MVHFFDACWIARKATFSAESSVEQLAALGGFVDHAVQLLNGIGGVDHLPDRRWVLEDGD